jgi:GDP-L-fucose synthase
MGFKGQLTFDSSKQDGTMRKLLNVSKVNGLGWKPIVDLEQGLKIVIKSYLDRMT